MKLLRFLQKNRESYALQVSKAQLLDLPALSEIIRQPIPLSLNELIQCGNDSTLILERLIIRSTEKERIKAQVKLGAVKILAPITSPPKIMCLGSNYLDHAAELNTSVPEEPVIFMKPSTTIIGHDESIVKPAFVKELDYETELVIIIGKKGKNITIDDVKNHIFGYTCFNDISARDIQFKDKQWTRKKP